MSASTGPAADSAGKTSVNWLKLPWLLLWLLPALSVVAGLTTVAIAVRHSDDMVKDDYYREGLAYNAQQQADRAAAAVRLHAMLVPVQSQLLVTVSAEQLPELPAELELLLSHPTDSKDDQRILLQRQADRQYRGELNLRSDTAWHVQLQPLDGSWRLRGRWQSPAPAQLKPEVY